MTDRLTILQGDALVQLATLPDQCVQCCVTSPPYWGLRDYGHAGQLGLEKTPEEYVAKMVAVFREVRRVLKDDGTLWLNLGDSYVAFPTGVKKNGTGFGAIFDGRDMRGNVTSGTHNKRIKNPNSKQAKSRYSDVDNAPHRFAKLPGLKHKDLIGIPWRVAFALQADGWWLRSEITWCKRACMPESIEDRPSTATEKIFLLAKSARYFYDHEAVKIEKAEATLFDSRNNDDGLRRDRLFPGQPSNGGTNLGGNSGRANLKNYWLLSPEPYGEAHFATFPSEIPRRAILAGSKPGDTILDPFGGSGTTGMVALELGRKATLIELNPDYCKLIERRCDVTPGLAL